MVGDLSLLYPTKKCRIYFFSNMVRGKIDSIKGKEFDDLGLGMI